MQTYLIVPDIHVPFHDIKAVKLVTKLIKELPQLSGMVMLGDFLDAFQISTYSKDPSRRNLLAEDIEDFKQILNEWSRNLKEGSNIHLLEGNHENRLSRYIASHCRDLHGLVPDWKTLLGIDLRNKVGVHKWHWHSYSKWNSCQIGDCTFFHGFYFNEHVAAQCLKKYRTNVVFGHTHRLQYIFDGQNYACSLGHISNEVETAHQPTPSGWQQAVALLHVDKHGKTTLDLLPIKNGRTILYGKSISV
jgi:UDP-2,3-diacylglucosamine pyrophosphatase LpxH